MLWTESFPPQVGGTETAAAATAMSLAERGHQLLVLTSLPDGSLPSEDRFHGTPVHRLPLTRALMASDPAGWMFARRRAARLKAELNPDVVDIFGFGPSALAHLETRAHDRAATTLRINWLEDSPTRALAPGSVLGRLMAGIGWVRALSSSVLAPFVEVMPELAERSSVIPNAFPMPQLRPAPLPSPPVLLVVARLVRLKGVDLALRAFAALLQAEPAARLVITGDGPERAALRSLASELGIERAVEFAGLLSHGKVHEAINGATLVVIPSRSEAFGNVAVEAAQMARPVVAFAVGGLPEVVAHGRTGLLVPAEDPQALAASLVSLTSDPRRASSMGTAARARAEKRFALAPHLDAVEAVYRRASSLQGGR